VSARPLHGLLAGARLALALLALGHLHVFHHLAKLVEKLLRLGHAALLHELLEPLEHLLQLVGRDLLHVLVLGHLLVVLRPLLGELAHVVLHRLAELLHQLGDLLVGGAVAHRLGQAVLRPAEPFQRIRQVAPPRSRARLTRAPRRSRRGACR
jgi:hypothetical protein